MLIQYVYTHTCGHTAFGPLIITSIAYPPSSRLISRPNPTFQQIALHFACPFCNPLFPTNHCAPGQGLICVLGPRHWVAMRSLRLSEITPEHWVSSFVVLPTGQEVFQHMAWIARPVGVITRDAVAGENLGGNGREREFVIGGWSEIRRNGVEFPIQLITRVGSAWREARSEEVEAAAVAGGTMRNSRMAGLFSQLNAARKYDELASSYRVSRIKELHSVGRVVSMTVKEVLRDF